MMTESPRRRPIDARERTGVLDPRNLERFAARWFAPADSRLSAIVATYWEVTWNLPPGERVEQRILEAPAVTLSIEAGAVAAPLVVTGANPQAWQRTIEGSGSAFGIRLRPAGLRVVSDLDAVALRGRALTLDATGDARAHDILSRIAAARPEDRPAAADAVLVEALAERPVSADGRLANAVVDTLTHDPRRRPGAAIVTEHGIGERAIQRALRSTLGMGPARVARRIRLQEAVRLLSLPGADAATIAVGLGYVDQAHLVNDFRAATGLTPGAYLRQLQG